VGDAQVALSQAAGKDRYSLLLSAENAEDDLRGIPVCS
jgi:serine/threonine-protein kinase